jgi:histidinol-phosphate phosphatase family protein
VLFDGVGRSIRRLKEAGFLVIVVTNQSGVGRGFFTESKLSEIHEKMREDLAKDGARLDAVYFCPHLPEEGCECRKPNIGMVLQALEDFDIDLSSSYVVGDSEREMELAQRIGAKGIKVSQGLDFNRAVDLILKEG